MKAKTTKVKSKRELVESMLKQDEERRERIMRSEEAIKAICERERVRLAVPSLHLQDGKLIPQIQLISLD